MAPELKPALIIIGSWIATLIVVAAYQRNAFADELALESARAAAQAEHTIAIKRTVSGR